MGQVTFFRQKKIFFAEIFFHPKMPILDHIFTTNVNLCLQNGSKKPLKNGKIRASQVLKMLMKKGNFQKFSRASLEFWARYARRGKNNF